MRKTIDTKRRTAVLVLSVNAGGEVKNQLVKLMEYGAIAAAFNLCISTNE